MKVLTAAACSSLSIHTAFANISWAVSHAGLCVPYDSFGELFIRVMQHTICEHHGSVPLCIDDWVTTGTTYRDVKWVLDSGGHVVERFA